MKLNPFSRKSYLKLKKGVIRMKDGAVKAFQAFSTAHAPEAIRILLRLKDAAHATLKAANVVSAALAGHTLFDFDATGKAPRASSRNNNRWTIKKRPSRHPNAPSRRGALAFA